MFSLLKTGGRGGAGKVSRPQWFRAAAPATRSGGSAGSARIPDEFQIVQNDCFLQYLVTQLTLWRNVFFFSWTSHLKHLVLRAFLEDCLPEMLSTLGVSAEVHEKVLKTSSDSSGGTGRLWRSGLALGGSGGALGGPGRALEGSIYRKTPDQPHQRPLCSILRRESESWRGIYSI